MLLAKISNLSSPVTIINQKTLRNYNITTHGLLLTAVLECLVRFMTPQNLFPYVLKSQELLPASY